MRVIARASHGQSPVISNRMPQSTNAPTAAEKSSVRPFAATISAAPGVDQAIEIGIRYRRLSPIASRPCSTQSTSRPDAASAGVAPTAWSPAMSSANELANPVSEPTIPAEIGWAMEVRRGAGGRMPWGSQPRVAAPAARQPIPRDWHGRRLRGDGRAG